MYTLSVQFATTISIVGSVLFISLPHSNEALKTLRYEFEDVVGGAGLPRSPWRSGASGGSSLHMFKGDRIKLTLCLNEDTSVNFDDLLYSNDGESELVNIKLDNEQLAFFKTEETVNGWGKYWNEFRSTHQLGKAMVLERGNHSLDFMIIAADCYGCEFDSLKFSLNRTVDSKQFICGAQLKRSNTPSLCAMNIDSKPAQELKLNTISHSPATTTHTIKSAMSVSLENSTTQTVPVRTSTVSSNTERGTTINVKITPKTQSMEQNADFKENLKIFTPDVTVPSTTGPPNNEIATTIDVKMPTKQAAELTTVKRSATAKPTTISSHTQRGAITTAHKATNTQLMERILELTTVEKSVTPHLTTQTTPGGSDKGQAPPATITVMQIATKTPSNNQTTESPTTKQSVSENLTIFKTALPLALERKHTNSLRLSTKTSSIEQAAESKAVDQLLDLDVTIVKPTYSSDKELRITDSTKKHTTQATSILMGNENDEHEAGKGNATQHTIMPLLLTTLTTKDPTTISKSMESNLTDIIALMTTMTLRGDMDKIHPKPTSNLLTIPISAQFTNKLSMETTVLDKETQPTVTPTQMRDISKASTTTEKETTQKPTASSTLTDSPKQTVSVKAMLPFLEQKSFPTKCLNSHNVDIGFNLESLKGVEIITRPSNRQTEIKNDAVNNRHMCNENVIWQIGNHDNRNAELGPIVMEETIDYDVTDPIDDIGKTSAFPGVIATNKTKHIILRYVLPKHINLKQRKLNFNLGLINVTNKVTIGLSYIDRAKKIFSNTQYKTLKIGTQTLSWTIPTRSVSPLLENQLHLYFDDDISAIEIDYMALARSVNVERTKAMFVGKTPQWKIRGKVYIARKGEIKNVTKDGMMFRMNGKIQNNSFAELSIFRKPNWKVLTIQEDGTFFPYHENRQIRRQNKPKDMKVKEKFLRDVNGFRFNKNDGTISDVKFSSKTNILTVVYKDGTFVVLLINYSKFQTKIRILDSSLNALSFFGTYISDSLSSLNTIEIDDSIRKHILDDNISNIKGQKFRLFNTLQNSVFRTNNKYEVSFNNV